MKQELINLWKEMYKCRKCISAISLPLPFYINIEKYDRVLFIGRNPGLPHHGQYSNETHTKEFSYEEWMKRYKSGLKVSNVGNFYQQIARECKLEFDNFCITNICKCSFENNRELTQKEINNCLFWLEQQLVILKPDSIIALGKTASDVLKQPYFNKYKIFHSLHPTYLIVYNQSKMNFYIQKIAEFINKNKK